MILDLGRVTVAVPGTPVQATVNQSVPATRVPTQAIMFQVIPANAGVVYIGRKGMVKGASGEYALLPKPSSATTGPFTSVTFSIPLAPAGLNAADFYVDADNANDGVIVSLVVQ